MLLKAQEVWYSDALNYIHENPVVAGFVDRAEHYPYSSAIDYAGEKGRVKIEMISG